MEEEDEIVNEVDVFLNKEVLEKLWILQYPVRPVDSPYDPKHFISTKVKPKQKQLHLEVALDTGSSCYSASKGEHYAMNVDGPTPKGPPSYTSGKLDKLSLVSSQGPADVSRYAVGVLHQGAIHLTPLSTIIQMRPDLNYLDKAEAAAKARAQQLQIEAGESSQDEDEIPEVKAVTMKYSRPESEEQKSRRLASYEYLTQKQREESWLNCRFQPKNTRASAHARDKLLCKVTDSSDAYCTQPEYLKSLIPLPTVEKGEAVALPENVLSQSQLRSMPLNERVRAIILNAKVIRWSQLMELLGREVDSSAALKALQQVAVLVQGCWVVKSDLVYPKDTFSSFNNSPAEVMCRARDYLLLRFTQNDHITRKEVASIVKIPSEELKEMFEQISHPKPKLGWVFVFDYDSTFVSRHKDVAQRQQMLWDAQKEKLTAIYKLQSPVRGGKDKKKTVSVRKRNPSSKSQSDVSDAETQKLDSCIIKVEQLEGAS